MQLLKKMTVQCYWSMVSRLFFFWLRNYLYGNLLYILPLNALMLKFFSICFMSNYLVVIEKYMFFFFCLFYTYIDTGCKQEKCQGASCLFLAKFFLRREVYVMIMTMFPDSCGQKKRKKKKAWVGRDKIRITYRRFFFIKKKRKACSLNIFY